MSLIAFFLALFFCSCATTITPEISSSEEISIVEGQADAGVIGFVEQGGNTYLHIKKPTAEKYQALIEKYGGYFVPELRKGGGLTQQSDGTFFLQLDYIEKFMLMNTWFRSGRPEKAPSPFKGEGEKNF